MFKNSASNLTPPYKDTIFNFNTFNEDMHNLIFVHKGWWKSGAFDLSYCFQQFLRARKVHECWGMTFSELTVSQLCYKLQPNQFYIHFNCHSPKQEILLFFFRTFFCFSVISKKVVGLNPLSSRVISISLCLCGFSPGTPVSSHSTLSRVRLICDFKLPKGVNVLCISPATDWWPLQGVPRFSAHCISGRNWLDGWMDGWMDQLWASVSLDE